MSVQVTVDFCVSVPEVKKVQRSIELVVVLELVDDVAESPSLALQPGFYHGHGFPSLVKGELLSELREK